MIKKTILLFSILFCFSALTYSQLEKTIHQTFEVDGKSILSFNLISDSTQIIPWAGTTILTETKVELYDASPSILAHFMDKEQRYTIDADTTGNGILLFSVNKERKPIRTRHGECYEQMKTRVFVPEDFTLDSDQKYVRSN